MTICLLLIPPPPQQQKICPVSRVYNFHFYLFSLKLFFCSLSANSAEKQRNKKQKSPNVFPLGQSDDDDEVP